VEGARIGTRESILARWQADFVRQPNPAGHRIDADVVIIRRLATNFNSSFAEIGAKGVFSKRAGKTRPAKIRSRRHASGCPDRVHSRLCLFPFIGRRNEYM